MGQLACNQCRSTQIVCPPSARAILLLFVLAMTMTSGGVLAGETAEVPTLGPDSICRTLSETHHCNKAGEVSIEEILDGARCFSQGIGCAAESLWSGGPQALTRGFASGVVSVSTDVARGVVHPVTVFNALNLTPESASRIQYNLVEEWQLYERNATDDPQRFSEMTGYLLAAVLLALLGAGLINWTGRTLYLAHLQLRHLHFPFSNRAARMLAIPLMPVVKHRVFRIWRSMGRARFLYSVAALARARQISLTRRRAARVGGVRRLLLHVLHLAQDLARGVRGALRRPKAFGVYAGWRLGGIALALITWILRVLWSQLKLAAIPILVVLNLPIADSVSRNEQRAQAEAAVKKQLAELPANSTTLHAEQVQTLVIDISQTFETYRKALLEPIMEEDSKLDIQLKELDAELARITHDNTRPEAYPRIVLDARIESILNRYARRHLNLIEDLFVGSVKAPRHSRCLKAHRITAYFDEIELLTSIEKRLTRPNARRPIDIRVAELETCAMVECDLAFKGYHKALMELAPSGCPDAR